MFGALKRGRFRSLASLILVVNVVGELQRKRTLAVARFPSSNTAFLFFNRITFYLAVRCRTFSENKSVKFQVKIQTVAEKTAKNFMGYFILTHPVGLRMGQVSYTS